MNDDLLLARLRARDPQAFEDLVRGYGARLLAVARRIVGSEDDARDVLQDAFLSASRGIDGFTGGSKVSTWLHRIVVNAALMKLRSRRRRNEESIEELLPRFDATGAWADAPGGWDESADVLLERREVRDRVRRCIAKLPESYRTVLVLRDIEDLDTDEAAELLGITANAAKIRLHRARQALRTLLAQELGVGARSVGESTETLDTMPALSVA